MDDRLRGDFTLSKNFLEAIQNAQSNLLSKQKINGYWSGIIHTHARSTSSHILLDNYIGVKKAQGRMMVNWLFEHQNPNGSWGEDQGDLMDTCIAYLALKSTGVSNNSEAMIKAKRYIETHGDLKNVDLWIRVFYALYGEISWDEIEEPPIEMVLVPGWTRHNLSGWGRPGLIPLLVLITIHKYRKLSLLQKLAVWYVKRMLLEHQNLDGSWFDTDLPVEYSTLALFELGYPVTHPRITKALQWLDLKVEPNGLQRCFELKVWDTALSVQALRHSGIPPSHPCLLKAGEWLLQSQLLCGGWAFDPNNRIYPDLDDTAFCVNAIAELNALRCQRKKTLDRAKFWLLNMQSKDGGWATYDRSLIEKTFGALPSLYVEPMIAIQDPSVADITGHVLSALGTLGYTKHCSPVQRAIAFLKKDQEDGAWWGRWGTCYTYGTSAVLTGLKAVVEDMTKPYVRKAVDWIVIHQNPDGGWGETIKSYFDSKFAGIGDSTVEQTAWSVMGLLAAGEKPNSETLTQGIKYIIDHQKKDGGWAARDTAAALTPYKNSLYGDIFGLWALSMYKVALFKECSSPYHLGRT